MVKHLPCRALVPFVPLFLPWGTIPCIAATIVLPDHLMYKLGHWQNNAYQFYVTLLLTL